MGFGFNAKQVIRYHESQLLLSSLILVCVVSMWVSLDRQALTLNDNQHFSWSTMKSFVKNGKNIIASADGNRLLNNAYYLSWLNIIYSCTSLIFITEDTKQPTVGIVINMAIGVMIFMISFVYCNLALDSTISSKLPYYVTDGDYHDPWIYANSNLWNVFLNTGSLESSPLAIPNGIPYIQSANFEMTIICSIVGCLYGLGIIVLLLLVYCRAGCVKRYISDVSDYSDAITKSPN